MKSLNGIQVEKLVEYLDKIKANIDSYSDVPMKPLPEYTVNDIVKLRCGYELINQDIESLKTILDLD